MNSKHLLLLTVGIVLVTLIACTKDTDSFSLDPSATKSTTARGTSELSISYDMSSSQNIEPTSGSIKDLCALDVKIIYIPSSTTSVTTTLGPDGQACLKMVETIQDKDRGKRGGKDDKNTTVTEYCNGVLVFTDTDGTTTTVETVIDVTMFKTIYESYYYTETQKDSVMNLMILEAEKSGAKVKKNGNALTITEIDAEGNTVTTVYDIKNHVVVATSTVDKDGNIISKTTLGYKCTPDGKIIPDFVISYNYKDNMICSDPIYTVEQVQFENFQITL